MIQQTLYSISILCLPLHRRLRLLNSIMVYTIIYVYTIFCKCAVLSKKEGKNMKNSELQDWQNATSCNGIKLF